MNVAEIPIVRRKLQISQGLSAAKHRAVRGRIERDDLEGLLRTAGGFKRSSSYAAGRTWTGWAS